MSECKFIKDLKRVLSVNSIPICYYCGKNYVIDELRSTKEEKIWMPDCDCLNKPTIRIVLREQTCEDD